MFSSLCKRLSLNWAHFCLFNPLSTRPHQNVVWCNNSWLYRFSIKQIWIMCQKKEKNILQKMSHHLSQLMLWWLIGIILGEIICKSSNWQHIQRLKITILGANWQMFRLERIAKCSYFILSTQDIKFYWFVLKLKKFMLPWWYNRGWCPLGNTYLGASFWMG